MESSGGPALPEARRITGLTSASGRDFDYRARGFEPPLLLLFLPAAILLIAGLIGFVRRWGPRPRPPARKEWTWRGAVAAAARVFRFGLVQQRLAARPVRGAAHLMVFWGFVVLAAGSLAIAIDVHLLAPLGLSPARGAGYRWFHGTLDAAGLGLVAGATLGLLRRARPRDRDAAGASSGTIAILAMLLVLGISGFLLEGLRIRLEGAGREPWSFAGTRVASLLGAIMDPGSARGVHALMWWGHAALALALIAAIPFTRLRHAFVSLANIAVAPGEPSPALAVPFLLREIQAAGAADVRFGAATARDLSWPDRLAISACVESGRCSDVCPAQRSGAPLSPRDLMKRLASRAAEGAGAALLDAASDDDAIWSCTMCGACGRACPVLADPLRPIAELRRGRVGANRAGAARDKVLEKLWRTGNPLGAANEARARLPVELGVRTLRQDPEADLVYWIGCAATFDPRVRRTAAAMTRLLKQAGVRFALLGAEETCSGDPARRIGEEGLFQEIALRNAETFQRHGVSRILTHCAHCFNTFRNEYPAIGAWRGEVIHHASFLAELVAGGRIRPHPRAGRGAGATFHDSCYVARFNGIVGEPRAALRGVPGLALREMDGHGRDAACCGGGGGAFWYGSARRETMGGMRMREARRTGAGLVVSECPFCLKMLEDGAGASQGAPAMPVRDIAEVMADALGPESETPAIA